MLLDDGAGLARLAGRRVGLLANRSSRTRDGLGSAVALKASLGAGLVRLFAPEHGWSGLEPEGAPDSVEPESGLPVHSLYGPRRAPDAAALADLDLVLVDLQDVGVRCYTYAATAALLLAAFAKHPRRAAIVLDRANPLGTGSAGPRLDPGLRSFIGYFDVPFQHGRTLGGLLRDWAERAVPDLDLAAIPAPAPLSPPAAWVAPSPSLRDWTAARLYPGLVLLEGTSVAEGRGTDRPFHCVLAPGLDGARLAAEIGGWSCGVAAEPARMTPASGKFAGESCTGVVLDPRADLAALAFGVRLVAWLARHCPGFSWRRGKIMATEDGAGFAPVEGAWLDYLLGDAGLRRDIDAGVDADTLVKRWANTY